MSGRRRVVEVGRLSRAVPATGYDVTVLVVVDRARPEVAGERDVVARRRVAERLQRADTTQRVMARVIWQQAKSPLLRNTFVQL